MKLQIHSEIGKLRTVVIHQPGKEIDRMVPSMMQNLLFDDILFGTKAREEHRRFQQLLRFVAQEVLEIQQLLEEVLLDEDKKQSVLQGLVAELHLSPDLLPALSEMPAGQLAAALVEGIERESPEISGSLDSLFLLPPVPNYFFQRDPAIAVGDRLIRASMATPARSREPLISGAVFEHSSRFSFDGEPFWFREFSSEYSRPVSFARMRPTIEGGDILVLRDDLLLIGYSERTEKITIERLAEALRKGKSSIKRILVVAIPPARSYMHLDTVFTQINSHECLCYPPMILAGGAEEADVYVADLTKKEITWTTEADLLTALKHRKIDLEPIFCGGPDPIDQQREQWTDGANAFALAPGVLLLYDRNTRTCEELSRHGYQVVTDDDLLLGRRELELSKPGKKYAILLTSTELSRARGGPRCMTMPLFREELS